MKEFRKVIVAVDGSENSLRAMQVAMRLADGLGVGLVLLHVFPMVTDDVDGALGLSGDELDKARRKAARETFDAVLSELDKRPQAVEEVALMGDIAEEIVEWLDDSPELLLVMGRRGHSAFGSLLLGSVSDKVLRHTHTPVTVVS